jgi:hypothetical protein
VLAVRDAREELPDDAELANEKLLPEARLLEVSLEDLLTLAARRGQDIPSP